VETYALDYEYIAFLSNKSFLYYFKAEEAKIKVSVVSGDRVDNKAKLETIKQEEEIIKSEQVEKVQKVQKEQKEPKVLRPYCVVLFDICLFDGFL
jgi:hypothetical protein